jgi:UTP--glucose-1-phosphate uridylyltransferase
MALMSDAYEVTEDFRMVLKDERAGVPPTVKLDGAYKFVDDLYKLIPGGAPSLVKCTKLTVEGEQVEFKAGVVIIGKVTIKNASGKLKFLKKGVYEDTTIEL